MPGAPDDDEILRGLERRRVDLGRRANDESVRAGDRLKQLLRRQSQLDVDLVAGVAKLLETRLSNLLGD